MHSEAYHVLSTSARRILPKSLRRIVGNRMDSVLEELTAGSKGPRDEVVHEVRKSYIVELAPEAAKQLRRLPRVRWVGPYQPAYRIDPNVFPEPSKRPWGEVPRDEPKGTRKLLISVFHRDAEEKESVAKVIREAEARSQSACWDASHAQGSRAMKAGMSRPQMSRTLAMPLFSPNPSANLGMMPLLSAYGMARPMQTGGMNPYGAGTPYAGSGGSGGSQGYRQGYGGGGRGATAGSESSTAELQPHRGRAA